MTGFIKKSSKPALYFIMLCFAMLQPGSAVYAQISPIENLINKVESFKNYSYRAVTKLKDMSADTTIALNTALFLKAPDNKPFGYLYSIETDHKTETFHKTDLYDGTSLNILSIEGRTYFPEQDQKSEYYQSLLGNLIFLKTRYNDKPYQITTLTDTTINGVVNSHIVAHVYDTLDNKEHLYSDRGYYINKKTGLPGLVIIKGRYKYNGLINTYYNETRYFDYITDRPNITAANFAIPKNFKPRKKQAAPPALLATGTTAPNWSLYDVNGKKMSLSQLKGKVVLLDFYFIGCSGCMASINPLNAIYEKYKNKGLIIASLTARDSKRAVLDFEKRYTIKYPGYINAADVVKAYHVTAFPTFYFIDKDGKIANVFVGYNDDFEEKVSSTISKLLDNK